MVMYKISADGHNRLIADINVTPFVDVMLVLLVIFMITAPLLQQGMPVNLPQAESPPLKRSKTDVIVSIQADGKIYVGEDRKPIALENLTEELQGIYATKEQKDLYIKADSDLLYGAVVKVMSIAKKAGVERIGMLTQPELTTR